STAGVEDAVALLHDGSHREAPPAPVETGRHHVVHHVVDGRDAVEHRLYPLGRQRPDVLRHDCPAPAPATPAPPPFGASFEPTASTHLSTSVFSTPSWSRQRATTKSTRSSTVSGRW